MDKGQRTHKETKARECLAGWRTTRRSRAERSRCRAGLVCGPGCLGVRRAKDSKQVEERRRRRAGAQSKQRQQRKEKGQRRTKETRMQRAAIRAHGLRMLLSMWYWIAAGGVSIDRKAASQRAGGSCRVLALRPGGARRRQPSHVQRRAHMQVTSDRTTRTRTKLWSCYT